MCSSTFCKMFELAHNTAGGAHSPLSQPDLVRVIAPWILFFTGKSHPQIVLSPFPGNITPSIIISRGNSCQRWQKYTGLSTEHLAYKANTVNFSGKSCLLGVTAHPRVQEWSQFQGLALKKFQ